MSKLLWHCNEQLQSYELINRPIYRIRQNIRGGKLSRFSRILAKRESFTIESFPSSQLENFIIIP